MPNMDAYMSAASAAVSEYMPAHPAPTPAMESMMADPAFTAHFSDAPYASLLHDPSFTLFLASLVAQQVATAPPDSSTPNPSAPTQTTPSATNPPSASPSSPPATSHSTIALIGAIAGLVAAGMLALIGVVLWRRHSRKRNRNPHRLSIDEPIFVEPFPAEETPANSTVHLLSIFPDKPASSSTPNTTDTNSRASNTGCPSVEHAIDGGALPSKEVLPPMYDPRWGSQGRA